MTWHSVNTLKRDGTDRTTGHPSNILSVGRVLRFYKCDSKRSSSHLVGVIVGIGRCPSSSIHQSQMRAMRSRTPDQRSSFSCSSAERDCMRSSLVRLQLLSWLDADEWENAMAMRDRACSPQLKKKATKWKHVELRQGARPHLIPGSRIGDKDAFIQRSRLSHHQSQTRPSTCKATWTSPTAATTSSIVYFPPRILVGAKLQPAPLQCCMNACGPAGRDHRLAKGRAQLQGGWG